jgi:glycine cleavage system H protein
VKAVSEVYAPLSGEVTEINQAVDDSPETINEDPYGRGWLAKVKLSDPSEVDDLMDAAAYRKLLEEND